MAGFGDLHVLESARQEPVAPKETTAKPEGQKLARDVLANQVQKELLEKAKPYMEKVKTVFESTDPLVTEKLNTFASAHKEFSGDSNAWNMDFAKQVLDINPKNTVDARAIATALQLYLQLNSDSKYGQLDGFIGAFTVQSLLLKLGRLDRVQLAGKLKDNSDYQKSLDAIKRHIMMPDEAVVGRRFNIQDSKDQILADYKTLNFKGATRYFGKKKPVDNFEAALDNAEKTGQVDETAAIIARYALLRASELKPNDKGVYDFSPLSKEIGIDSFTLTAPDSSTAAAIFANNLLEAAGYEKRIGDRVLKDMKASATAPETPAEVPEKAETSA